jgi:large subunit ribosomal protein L15
MKIHELKSLPGSKKKKKRVGRGNASGCGTYSTKGMKGQRSRSGVSFYPGFEGGKTPLVKLLPKKKGFRSMRIKPVVINVVDIQKNFKEGDTVDKKKLKEAGLIKSEKCILKLLGDGEITKKVVVVVDRFSESAKKKIEESGGKLKIFKVAEKKEKSKK